MCRTPSSAPAIRAPERLYRHYTAPTGPFRAAIRDRETGFLPAEPQSWAPILLQLVNNPALRRSIGAAAYRHVVRAYGPEVRVKLVAAMLDEFVGRSWRGIRANVKI